MTKIRELRIKAEIIEAVDDELDIMEEQIGYQYRTNETGEYEKVKIANEDLSEYETTKLNLIRQIRKDLLKLI